MARRARVVHLVDEERTEEHELADHARVLADGGVIYPAPPDEQRSLFDGQDD